MITGRIPEITIKFTEKPDLPTEGKKVTLGSVDTINATKLKPKQIRQIPNNIRQFCQNG